MNTLPLDAKWTPLTDLVVLSPEMPKVFEPQLDLPEPARTLWGAMPSIKQLLAAVTQTAEDGTQYGTYKGVAFKLAPA